MLIAVILDLVFLNVVQSYGWQHLQLGETFNCLKQGVFCGDDPIPASFAALSHAKKKLASTS